MFHFKSKGRTQIALLVVSAGLLVSGCGGRPDGAPETFSVSGEVTLDGQPLADASVMFLPQNVSDRLQPASGRTNRSGSYRLQFNAAQAGAQPGDYRVVISTVRENDEGDNATEESLPAVYNRESTLTASVSEDSRVFDFPLKSSAGPPPQLHASR